MQEEEEEEEQQQQQRSILAISRDRNATFLPAPAKQTILIQGTHCFPPLMKTSLPNTSNKTQG
eukprot:1145148-Pelagomonas_calceolata.AAC.6